MKNVSKLSPAVFLRLKDKIIPMTILLITVMASPAASLASEADFSFQALQQRLIKDKNAHFSAARINQIYNKPGVACDVKGISSYFRHQEGKLNYDQFLSARSIQKARNYMRKHYADLLKAEIDYGVDKEVITAILLVETRLGTYVGNRPVINILSTMAALEDPSARNQFWEKIPEENRITRQEYEEKALRKAKWAYKELLAFLTYTEKEGMNPSTIKGSYAGAMGFAQFMPSNIITLAKDGNKDGSVNLFHHEDAIASIANYLKRYGWKPGIQRKDAEKVIYHYNHSSYYVETVLKITESLKA